MIWSMLRRSFKNDVDPQDLYRAVVALDIHLQMIRDKFEPLFELVKETRLPYIERWERRLDDLESKTSEFPF